MQTIILPGGSVSNKDWLEECAKSLKVEGDIRPIYWEHWSDPESKIDWKQKAVLIARHTKGDQVNLIAKSIGMLVASYVIQAIPTQINKVVFCGIPVKDVSKEELKFIELTIKKLDGKVIVFQNENDPHGKFERVKDFGKVIPKPRVDHHYPYYEDFNKFLQS